MKRRNKQKGKKKEKQTSMPGEAKVEGWMGEGVEVSSFVSLLVWL